MYNLIIKHCMNKNRTYDIRLFYIDGNLYFKITDKESNVVLHNDSLECSEEESKILCNLITSEFILNHALRYAAYIPMEFDDIALYNKLNNCQNPIKYKNNDYILLNEPLRIHVLENTTFTLNVYLFNGIDEDTEKLHHMAMDKANECAMQFKKNRTF